MIYIDIAAEWANQSLYAKYQPCHGKTCCTIFGKCGVWISVVIGMVGKRMLSAFKAD